VVFSFAWSDDDMGGMPGAAVGTPGKLVVDHGSSSPWDLHTTLVAAGPDFRSGWRNPVPVGNIDISPTLMQLLQLESGTQTDGRVLVEALRDWTDETPPVQTTEAVESFAARGRQWRQRLWFRRALGAAYLAGGCVELAESQG
jgi:hypothetical protein